MCPVTAHHGVHTAGPSTTVTVGPSPSIIRDTIAVTQPPEFQGDVDLIQSELSKLSTIGSVTVTADSTVPDTDGQCAWRVTFETNAGDLPSLQVAKSGTTSFDSTATLTGGDTVTITDDVVQGTSMPLSGDFTLEFDGQRNDLSTVGKVEVNRFGPDVNNAYVWDVMFLTNLGPLPLIKSDDLDLQGTVATASVSKEIVGVLPPYDGPDLAVQTGKSPTRQSAISDMADARADEGKVK